MERHTPLRLFDPKLFGELWLPLIAEFNKAKLCQQTSLKRLYWKDICWDAKSDETKRDEDIRGWRIASIKSACFYSLIERVFIELDQKSHRLIQNRIYKDI